MYSYTSLFTRRCNTVKLTILFLTYLQYVVIATQLNKHVIYTNGANMVHTWKLWLLLAAIHPWAIFTTTYKKG